MEKPGGAQRFSIDKAYSYINTGQRPVYTVDDIAEELGVSDTTVRNNLDELESLDGVKSIDIGRTTAYYVEISERSVAATVTPNRSPRWDNRMGVQMAADRGLWKRQREFATRYKREDDLDARMYLHRSLVDYVISLDKAAGSVNYRSFIYDRYGGPDGAPHSVDSSEWPLSEESLRYYFSEVEYYSSMSSGGIQGFAFIEAEGPGVVLGNEYGYFIPDDVSDDELNEAVPSFGDILEAGQIWDAFVCELFDWRW